jgi:hypothetical protein
VDHPADAPRRAHRRPGSALPLSPSPDTRARPFTPAPHRPLEVIVSTNPSETTPSPDPGASHRSLGARLGADWAAVIVAAVIVLLAVTGLLPSIPFLVK